jgi:hypothetical protein
MIKQILIAAAILAATAASAQAQNYDFDLILVTGVPGAQGPVPVIFDGSFTYQNSTFSDVDIAISGAWGPATLDRYAQGAFESSGPNPQSEFFLTFTTARPFGGGGAIRSQRSGSNTHQAPTCPSPPTSSAALSRLTEAHARATSPECARRRSTLHLPPGQSRYCSAV